MAPASVPVAGSLAAALVLAVVFGGRRRRLMPDGPLERLLERSLPSREYRLAIRIHRAGIAA